MTTFSSRGGSSPQQSSLLYQQSLVVDAIIAIPNSAKALSLGDISNTTNSHKTTKPTIDKNKNSCLDSKMQIDPGNDPDKDKDHILASDEKVDDPADEWNELFSELVSYQKQHNGSLEVPWTSKEHGKLTVWVARQRESYGKGKLSIERATRLTSIGFEWNLRRGQWMDLYNRLVAYRQKHGTTRVPFDYPPDYQLGLWVGSQRQRCKEKTRIDLLNDIGFEWRALGKDSQWMAMYHRLVEYKKKHGSASQIRREEARLRKWVYNQRRECKKRDRIDLLNAIGFEWQVVDKNHQWMEMYERLVDYKANHGTTNAAKILREDPKLGKWIYTQRGSCKRRDRIDLLNAIGFEWKVVVDKNHRWRIMYERLVAYKNQHGTTHVPHDSGDPQLLTWVNHQRSQCKKQDRIDLLETIGFEWKRPIRRKNMATAQRRKILSDHKNVVVGANNNKAAAKGRPQNLI